MVKNVLCIPQWSRNQLSIQRFCHEFDAIFHLTEFGFDVKKETGRVILRGNSWRNLYFLQNWSIHCNISECFSLLLWHCRLCHPAPQILCSITEVSSNKIPHCTTCALGNYHRLSFERRKDLNLHYTFISIYLDSHLLCHSVHIATMFLL